MNRRSTFTAKKTSVFQRMDCGVRTLVLSLLLRDSTDSSNTVQCSTEISCFLGHPI